VPAATSHEDAIEVVAQHLGFVDPAQQHSSHRGKADGCPGALCENGPGYSLWST
jgi:hypothetical protein